MADIEKDVEQVIIKQCYQFYVKNRKNYSKNVEELLEKIKDGYEPNEADIFEIYNTDEKQNEEYRKIFELKQRVKDGKISKNDFDYLINLIGITDESIIQSLKNTFLLKGKIVDEYPENKKTR